MAAADMIYGRTVVTDRNAHIVAAAIKALKPKPHKCNMMEVGGKWVKWPAYEYWNYFIDATKLVHCATHCHKCGKLLGGKR